MQVAQPSRSCAGRVSLRLRRGESRRAQGPAFRFVFRGVARLHHSLPGTRRLSPWYIVIGGVANDKVFDTLEAFFDGYATKAQTIGRLRSSRSRSPTVARNSGTPSRASARSLRAANRKPPYCNDRVAFPKGIRRGAILSISAEELARLKAAFPPPTR